MSAQSTLKALGLNDKEIKIYLALLKHGRLIPASIAKLTGINRATVYSAAKNLQSKGIIAEDLGGKTLYFTPLPPRHLESLIRNEKRELSEKEKLVKEAVDQLSLLTAEHAYPVPKIRFVQEDELEKFLYDNTRKWIDNLHKKGGGIWWGFQDHSFVEHYEKWIHFSHTKEATGGKNYSGRIFSNILEVESKLLRTYPKTQRDVRTFPDTKFTASLWVAGDHIIMILTRQHPFYLFEIHDETLAHNIRETFKKLWAATKP